MSKLKSWKELPIGGLILDAGNAVEYETGSWRTYRPTWNEDLCIQCLRCWSYCPDVAIQLKEGKVAGIDYAHCKGCGICSFECPVKPEKAITMDLESNSADRED